MVIECLWGVEGKFKLLGGFEVRQLRVQGYLH